MLQFYKNTTSFKLKTGFYTIQNAKRKNQPSFNIEFTSLWRYVIIKFLSRYKNLLYKLFAMPTCTKSLNPFRGLTKKCKMQAGDKLHNSPLEQCNELSHKSGFSRFP